MAYRGWMGWVGARVLRAAAGGALRVAVAGGGGALLSGCMFGVEEEAATAKPVIGNYFDANCIPDECLYACCQGPEARPAPKLYGGKWMSNPCSELRTNLLYAEYCDLTQLDINYCPDDLGYEVGSCIPIPPEDVLRRTADGGTEAAGLTFKRCPPGGQRLTSPLEGVTFVLQE